MKQERSYSAVIISLHPEWWEQMKAGKKVLEIRKTRPRGNGPYTVLVYVTGGVGIVGEFVCDCFTSWTPYQPLQDGHCRRRIWEHHIIWKRRAV